MPAKGFSKFDIDLKYGQIREDKVREMFGDKTIEVKTEADYWFQRLELDESGEFCTLVFPTPILKKIVDKYKDKLTKNVGDNNTSKCVMLPIKKIFDKEFY